MIKYYSYQKGFTLIEIMIALIIGLFLTAGAIQIFTGTKNNNRLQENLSRMQENARFAIQFLTQDIQRASFDGAICGRGRIIDSAKNNLNINNVSEAIDAQYKFTTIPRDSNTLFGVGTNSLSGAIVGVDNVGLNGADRLILRSLGAMNGVRIVADMIKDPGFDRSSSDIQINASEAGMFSKGDIALITNCINADIFQITNNPSLGILEHKTGSSETPDNATSYISFAYKVSPNTKVYNLSNKDGVPFVVYDIANSGTPAVPGLSKGGQQLVPDIENMQIEFGQRLLGGSMSYVPASAGPDMNEVVSVRISLLVRSQDDFVATSPQSYYFPPDAAAPTIATDRRLRKVYTATITTRNRLN